ncbi:bifunctional adenosylcobinamide kinase/adenosylcobinamide-phosphate guanylyltransferase [Metabacillus sp. GX 13764]|uniref:bifunctional adenosylcobinamide kinase/adenosylcobinamide-phosphate guanylyltransferase n=1 Tax=Metabacillus kandeliae TaxID=2900151 RepID=UPI001E607F0D|nr:bifunctional adenosylcobinamide kinase/adenosylcobinamide-phosphate guanylyltransferase [Metabacillus kandeliae]MCD7035509.1 bifunctional adenosylcobinamide kinase/adenosylcobinamide-phosphate guanylyltransferase [Metabacillus kandeliae]
MLIFVSGGVRSGKSTFAEELAMKSDADHLICLATSRAADSEMAERIARHKQERAKAEREWRTIEKETAIGSLAGSFTKQDAVLLDCLTVLASNELFAGKGPKREKEAVFSDMIQDLSSLSRACHTFIIVSNEVFEEPPVYNGSSVRQYLSLLGSLHQKIVKMADAAYLVENGMPLIKKAPRASNDEHRS